jgi:hypothetical protein
LLCSSLMRRKNNATHIVPVLAASHVEFVPESTWILIVTNAGLRGEATRELFSFELHQTCCSSCATCHSNQKRSKVWMIEVVPECSLWFRGRLIHSFFKDSKKKKLKHPRLVWAVGGWSSTSLSASLPRPCCVVLPCT